MHILLFIMSTHCTPVNAILPNPRTLDGYTLRQNWPAISEQIYSQIYRICITLFFGVSGLLLL